MDVVKLKSFCLFNRKILKNIHVLNKLEDFKRVKVTFDLMEASVLHISQFANQPAYSGIFAKFKFSSL